MPDFITDNIFTHSAEDTCKYVTLSEFEEDFIIGCHIDVLAMPEDVDDVKENEILENPDLAIKIGTISGYLLLYYEMEKNNIDIHEACDAENADLEFVCSALMENDGPLEVNPGANVFYIHEIELEKEYDTEEVHEFIATKLYKIILAHYHVEPEILVYYPRPLPYDTRYEDIKKELTRNAYSEYLARREGKIEDDDKPHLVLSEDQVKIVMGMREEGYTYPEGAKDLPLWDKYQAAGFSEWKNTRVLYKIIQ